MYQGKFDAKKKKTSVDVTELVSQRNAAPARKAAPVKTPPVEEEVKAAVTAEEEILTRKKAEKKTAKKVEKKEIPAEAAPVAEKEAPAAEAVPAEQEAPAMTKKELKAQKKAEKKAKKEEKKAPKQAEPVVEVVEEPEKKKKGPRLGGVIFYTFYFMFILLFFVALFFGLRFLQGWLANFEAAQPTVKAQAVFDQIFTDPDWNQLYDAAGISGTTFEGKEAYVSYIENKVGDSQLNYLETSAGLSGDRKYIVRLGDEKVASFTLASAATETITDIPDWKLSAVELFYECNESYLIQKMDGHTAYINGVALDDNYTIQIATTVAEKYLPAGTTGVNLCTQQITGLMTMPTVTVKDENGTEMEVVYDETTRTFVEQTSANTITEEQQTVALEAVKAYSRFMIAEGDRGDIAKYFDASSDTYTSIVKSETAWMQDHNGYRFANETVSDYCRYSDDLFSVRVSMSLNITRTDGTVKETPVDQSLFFELQESGKWLCFEMTSVDVSEPVGKVRLTFKNGDAVLFSDFVENDASELTTPVVSVPEGKVFVGWVREDIDAEGRKTLTVVFTPDETGYVKLPANSILEPMTLEAFFENAP